MQKYKLKSAAIIVSILIIGLGLSSNPPNGKTNAPGEGNCYDCHSGTSSIDGTLEISGVPSTIEANTTYNLTVTSEYTLGNPTRAGFQMVVLDSNDDNIGTLSNPGSNSTITASNDRNYFEHEPAINFGGSTSVSWDVEWTSPAGPDMETITFYATTILANGNGANSNDRMKVLEYQTELTATTAPLEVTISEQMDISCFGYNNGFVELNVQGGTPPYSFQWSNGESSNPAFELEPGTNDVLITDDNGSELEFSVLINEPLELTSDILISPIDCYGLANGTIEIISSGGSGNYNYNWSNGFTSQFEENLSAGFYEITITDDNFCQTIVSTEIIEPDPIEISANVIDEECSSLGSISINLSGGTGDYTINWNNGVIGNTNSGLSAGDYSVTVTDENNCSIEQSYTINSSSQINYQTAISNISCYGVSDGSINLIFEDPDEVSSLNWSNGETGSSIHNLSPGSYSITIESVDMCQYESNFVVTQPDSLELSVTSSNSILCHGDLIDTLFLTATGGSGNYSFFNDMQTTNDTILNLGAGSYTFTSIDANNCTDTLSWTSNMPDSLYVNISSLPTTGDGNADGSVVIEIIGGISPYFINGNPVDSIQSFTGLLPGNYSFTLTDFNNCLYNGSYIIDEGSSCTLEFIEIEIQQPNCPGEEPLISLLNPTGGTPPFSIELPLEIQEEGEYPILVTDAEGCSILDTITIEYQDSQGPTPVFQDATVYVDESGFLGAFQFDLGSFDNCGGPINIEIDESLLQCNDLNNEHLIPTVLTDELGNTTDTNFVLTIIDTFPPSIFCLDDITIFDCMEFDIADPFVTDNCGIQIIESNKPDDFQLGTTIVNYTVTDYQGNVSFCETSVTIDGDLNYDIQIADVSCAGAQDGSYQVMANDSIVIVYENGLVNNLPVGTYYFTVIQGNCMLMDSIYISEPAPLELSNTIVFQLTESGASDGAIEISMDGGTLPYNYNWYDQSGNIISNESDINNLSEGIYYCIITDNNGCFFQTEDFYISFESSNKNPLFEDLLLYPNPFTEQLYIQSDHNIDMITIHDALGKYVDDFREPKEFIDLHFLVSGIYLIEVTINGEKTFRKIIKH